MDRFIRVEERVESADRPLILVFPFNYLSHYLRCIVLAEMFSHEYEVLFCESAEYGSKVEEAGFGSFSCVTWDGADVLDKLRKFDFSWLEEKSVRPAFESAVAAIDKFRPFVVIGDNYPALRMAADLKGVPYISLQNGYMSKYYAGTRPLSRRHPMYPYLSRLPGWLKDPLVRKGEMASFRRIQRTFNKIREGNGLASNESYFDELEGDLNLICDLAELFPQKYLPKKYVIVGPLIYDRPDSPEKPLPRLDPDKQTLFVCMGSTGDWEAVSFLTDPYYRKYNIITAGDTRSVLGSICLAEYDFLNASTILPQTDLAICHGGNGIINQCIFYDVPVLCRTAYFEQEWNVWAVEKRGWGRSLDGNIDRLEIKKIIAEWSGNSNT